MVLEVARQYGPRRTDGEREPALNVLNLLSARFLVLPKTRGALADAGHRREIVEPRDAPADATLVENPHALPRAWIVHEIVVLPPLQDFSPAAVRRRTEEILVRDGQLRDWRQVAVVESERASVPAEASVATLSVSESGASEACRIVRDEPDVVEVDVRLVRPGVVVLSDSIYPGWSATVTTLGDSAVRETPIWRANRILRAVPMETGEHRIVFRYQPRSFRVGAVVSSGGWFAVAAALIWLWRQRAVSRRADSS
jgi:hypothetical protein